MQQMYSLVDGKLRCLEMPAPGDFVMPGVRWGQFDELMTPAFWRGQLWQHQPLGTYESMRLGRTLVEEVAACLLGGFGMRAEIGLAAFARVRDRGLLEGLPTEEALERTLAEPLIIRGHRRNYRFPRQKARYLSACVSRLLTLSEPSDDVAFRNCLADFPGIGLKTASWVVRNYRNSNNVAIIDVHILRAGRHMGLFPLPLHPQQHYCLLEGSFIQFANAMNAAVCTLDALMWDYMRRIAALNIFPISRTKPNEHAEHSVTNQLDLISLGP